MFTETGTDPIDQAVSIPYTVYDADDDKASDSFSVEFVNTPSGDGPLDAGGSNSGDPVESMKLATAFIPDNDIPEQDIDSSDATPLSVNSDSEYVDKQDVSQTMEDSANSEEGQANSTETGTETAAGDGGQLTSTEPGPETAGTAKGQPGEPVVGQQAEPAASEDQGAEAPNIAEQQAKPPVSEEQESDPSTSGDQQAKAPASGEQQAEALAAEEGKGEPEGVAKDAPEEPAGTDKDDPVDNDPSNSEAENTGLVQNLEQDSDQSLFPEGGVDDAPVTEASYDAGSDVAGGGFSMDEVSPEPGSDPAV